MLNVDVFCNKVLVSLVKKNVLCGVLISFKFNTQL